MADKNEKKEITAKEVVIKNVIIDLGDGQELVLTMEKAKKLAVALEGVFGKEVIKEVIHEHHYDTWIREPYIWPKYDENPKYIPYNGLFWCGDPMSGGKMSCTSNKLDPADTIALRCYQ